MPRHLEPWTTLQRTPMFSGGPIREICRESVRLPDGREIDDYYTAKMGDYALIYAVTETNTVLLLRQYKHGVGRVCLTFPGGYVAPTEDPLVGARRELLEETGYEASQWTPLGSYVTNANQGCNIAHLFRADGCRPVAAPNPGDLEEMELVTMPESELRTPERFAEMAVLGYVTLAVLAARR